ncbi:MAG: glycosyltransferase family 4 protein [Methylococcales bacterium]|nr:glycosyltransferase family 4 protein [Methylococcales bacterium]
MHIALLSPLPPQQSGIADYVEHLLRGFDHHKTIKITLFSNTTIKNLLNYEVVDIDSLVENQLEDYDLVIYQLGNNIHYHQYMLALLKRYGGIVHLHDLVLHHMIAGINYQDEKITPNYFQIIKRHYGEDNKNRIQHLISEGNFIWESPEVVDYPLFEEFVQYADSCIVHSKYTFERVKAVFPKIPLYIIDQLYDLKPLKKTIRLQKILRIGVFGGIDLQKKVDIVIEVLAEIKTRHPNVNFRLDIVGAINETCNSIFLLPHQLGLEKNVFIHGRLDEQQYNERLAQTDVIIALRVPTMGETSAVVMQGLQLGIPVIVTNVGWYSELPEIVDKVSSIEVKQGLHALLLKYANPDYLQNKTEEISQYALENFDFSSYILRYQAILEREYHNYLNTPLYPLFAKAFKDLEIINDDILLHGRLKRLEALF